VKGIRRRRITTDTLFGNFKITLRPVQAGGQLPEYGAGWNNPQRSGIR
jgi:hypothetical protein